MIRTALFTALTLAMVLITSCKKDDDNNDLYPEGLHCKVDGIAWSANAGLTATKTTILSIVGDNADGTKLRVSIEDLSTGTYVINSFTNISVYTFSGFDFPPLNTEEGSLVVEDHDAEKKKIQGTFYFTGDNGQGDRVYLTEGTFNITYTE